MLLGYDVLSYDMHRTVHSGRSRWTGPLSARRTLLAVCCPLTPVGLTGGAGRDRTDGLLLAKQALSQLSYSPDSCLPNQKKVVGLDGFEPSTPALSRRCSNQLSYRPACQLTRIYNR
jgi:hypothetical protein